MNARTVNISLKVGIAILFVLFIGSVVAGIYLINQQSTKLTEQQVEAEVLEMQQTALTKAKKDLGSYQELGAIAKSIVPQDKDQAKTAREILTIAEKTGIPITSISFPTSSLGNAAAKKVETPTPAAGASSDAAPQAPAAPPVTQVKPVEGITGLYQLEIIIQSDPSAPRPYSNIQSFLQELETNRRTAQVSQFVITPSSNNINLLSFTLTLNVFIKP